MHTVKYSTSLRQRRRCLRKSSLNRQMSHADQGSNDPPTARPDTSPCAPTRLSDSQIVEPRADVVKIKLRGAFGPIRSVYGTCHMPTTASPVRMPARWASEKSSPPPRPVNRQ